MDGNDTHKAAVLAAVTKAIGTDGAEAILAPLLFARPPAHDLKAFEPDALAAAARAGLAALAAHRPGAPVVRIERPAGFVRQGRPQDLVTVVSDDMVFLFDSVTAEIAESAHEIHYISHPILDVRRDAEGNVVDFSTSHPSAGGSQGEYRTSLIQFALDPLPDEEARDDLCGRLRTILSQVARANDDFEPMRALVTRQVEALHRRARALEDADERGMVEESAQLLEWLRDDNFIFLGAREYDYVGDDEEGEALERREDDGPRHPARSRRAHPRPSRPADDDDAGDPRLPEGAARR